MASKVMREAAEKAIESGSNLADAINAAIRAQVRRIHDGGETTSLSMASVDAGDILSYFEVPDRDTSGDPYGVDSDDDGSVEEPERPR